MSFELKSTYGKQSVPVFKIRKQGAHHTISDIIVKIMLEGDIDRSWLEGENSQIVPTETQKNTCYALAMKTDFTSIEDYGLALGRDMLSRHKHLTKVNVDLEERLWERHNINGTPHNHVFYSSPAPIRRIAKLEVTRDSAKVTSGVSDMKLMKTTQSGFMGYIEDQYTNLKPVGAGGSSPDRIMCTEMVGTWTYTVGKAPEGSFATVNKAILEHLLDTFAGPADKGKYSKSLQETTYNMATSVLKKFAAVENVHLTTPNVHFYRYPLEQFGLKNDNVVFQSTDCHSTASGRIITSVSRKQKSRL